LNVHGLTVTVGGYTPAGDYIVTIEKMPKFVGELSLSEWQALEPMEQERYNEEQARRHAAMPREVPMHYADFATSPFRMTVSKGGEHRLEIDVAQKP
jgi:hypothetical protein